MITPLIIVTAQELRVSASAKNHTIHHHHQLLQLQLQLQTAQHRDAGSFGMASSSSDFCRPWLDGPSVQQISPYTPWLMIYHAISDQMNQSINQTKNDKWWWSQKTAHPPAQKKLRRRKRCGIVTHLYMYWSIRSRLQLRPASSLTVLQ